MGIALVFEGNSHAGSIRKYDLQRFQARRDLSAHLVALFARELFLSVSI